MGETCCIIASEEKQSKKQKTFCGQSDCGLSQCALNRMSLSNHIHYSELLTYI